MRFLIYLLLSVQQVLAAELYPSEIDLGSLDGQIGFEIAGKEADDATGSSVWIGGDINNDGINDIVVGASRAEQPLPSPPDSGEVYVVFGGPTVGQPGRIEAGALDGSNGFTLRAANIGEAAGGEVTTGDIIR